MGVKYTNNAKTTISSGINNSVTTIPVASSSGFPSLSGSDYFYATLDDATNLEVVKVTAVSGTNWTVVRAQDDTTARAWSSGDDIELRLNAALLTDVVNDAMSDAFTRQAFTGDGSTTAFTLSKAPATENDLIVFIEGVFQTQSAYSVSGTTLTFSAAPANSREIIVYNITAAVNGDSLSQNNFTGDGSDTTFTLGTDPLHENNTMVFLDGVYQHKSTYSVSGTTLTFSTAPASGVAIECITHTQTEVNTPASNSVVTASIVDDNVTQAKIADDAVGADQLAASAVVTASIVDDNVTQAKIADDAVGADQLASSAVVTASIVDDAVTTAKIADDQVTLAKMAGLARGKIIYGDSSGNPAALTVGSAGTVLTSDGTDISWAEEVATNYLPLAGGTMTGDLILGDNIRLELGAESGGDAQLFHSGSNAQFINTTGDTYIQNDNIVYITNEATSKNSAAFDTDGAVTLYYDNSAAIATASDGVSLADSKKVKLGAGNDLQLYHDGSDSYITDTGTGNLLIQYSDLYFSKDAGSSHSVVFRSTGKVGIGTTSPLMKAHIKGATGDAPSNDSNAPANGILFLDSGGGYGMSLGTDDSNTGSAWIQSQNTSTSSTVYDLLLNPNGGKVAIGADHADEPLTVRSSGENVNTYLLELGNDLHASNTKDAWIKFVGGAATTDNSWTIGILSDTFRIVQLGARGTAPDSGTERFRINHLGRQGYNGSAGYNAHGNFVGEVGASYKALSFERTVGGGETGSIVTNVGSTTYNTTSDYRLKENVDYDWDATTRLKQLKPARFNWIKDDTNTLLEGFLAHEVSSIVPEAVTGEKDAMTDPVLWGTHDTHPLPEGVKVGDVKTAPVPDYQGIDHSKLVPLLVKTVQELEARIKTLEDA